MILDQKNYEDFKYSVSCRVLEYNGIDVSSYPVQPSNANAVQRRTIAKLMNTMCGESRSVERIFEGCSDVREMIGKLMYLNEVDLMVVCSSSDVPKSVQRHAEIILNGDIKNVHEALNQALGKPVERMMVATQKVSPLEEMSASEIRALLSSGDDEEDYE
jgi:hypothetical protein